MNSVYDRRIKKTLEWKKMIDSLMNNKAILDYVLNRKRSDFKNINELIKFFGEMRTKNLIKSDLELAWSIFLWIGHNVVYDEKGFRTKIHMNTAPEFILKSGQACCREK